MAQKSGPGFFHSPDYRAFEQAARIEHLETQLADLSKRLEAMEERELKLIAFDNWQAGREQPAALTW